MRKIIKLLTIITLVMFCFTGCSEDLESDYSANNVKAVTSRGLRTKIKGNGEDVFTIMIYMCGSDLEEKYSAATDDINEILNADISDKVNIIIETGGARQWHNGISGENNQIYKANSGSLELLEDLDKENMTDPNTLAEFISYSAENYPADRYGLIMWDHGGGAISGYGVDQNFEGSSLEIYEIGQAIKDSGVIFDFVGFDACLMGTIETGLMLEEYSDYLIASEETEPGCGWYYTDWISMLSENTSIDTVSLSKKIIDDYIEACDSEAFLQDATLAVMDLTAIKDVYDKLCSFAGEADGELTNHNYTKISKGRSKSKAFAEGEVDHVDLVDLAKNTELSGSENLINAVRGCVKYSKVSDTVSNANGISLYFPYEQLEFYDEMTDVYSKLKLDQKYVNFMNRFVNIMVGGQENYSGNSSPMEALNSNSSNAGSQTQYNEYDWYDSDTIGDYSDYYGDYSYEQLEIVSNGDGYMLELTDEDWDIISEIELQVLYDDGEGYIDLGYDNLYETDDYGNLLISYDNTWVNINGQVVNYVNKGMEEKEDGSWVSYGYVQAYVNDEYVNIVIAFSDKCPEGKVLGYTYDYENSSICLKGLVSINEGDVIEFLCDYYTYDEEYEDSYVLGDPIIVDSSGLTVSYEDVGEGECLVYYVITDIYGNQYWTEPLMMY